jgi:predicted acetyltransferase
MADPVVLRPITSEEIAQFRDAFALVFGFEAGDGAVLDSFAGWIERDRTIAGFDGDALIATGGALSFRLVVPGGETIPAAGLTVVSVAPTHRRQGLLRRIMGRHFDDAADRGEPVSILYASESSIYGRFGYGAATEAVSLSIRRAHADLRGDLPAPEGTFRIVVDDGARGEIEDVFARSVSGVAGSVLRRPADWDRFFFDPPAWRDGATPYRWVMYERGGKPCGYAKYRQKAGWNDQGPDATVVVSEIQAVDGEAYAALWRFLLSIDLASRLEASGRPSDDPLVHLLADPRRLERKVGDSLWLRLLDIPAALAARRYRVAGSLVIRVDDAFRPDAGGTFRLDGGPDGAECTPTGDAPDLLMATADLAGAYLGARRLPALAWLGLLDGDPEAVRLADDMFTTSREPHCSVFF